MAGTASDAARERAAAYAAALYFVVAARRFLERDGIIDLPPAGSPLPVEAGARGARSDAAFLEEAWRQSAALLSGVTMAPSTVSDVRRAIAAGRRLVRADPRIALTSSEYEKWRRLITTRFLTPAPGSRPHWPPPLQTLLNHAGPTWNAVKEKAGWDVTAPIDGRVAGDPPSDPELRALHVAALAAFLTACERQQMRPAQARYKGWSANEREAGRARPTASSIRLIFGSWTTALAAARTEGALVTPAPEAPHRD